MRNFFAACRGNMTINVIRFELLPRLAHPPDVGVAVWIDGENLMDSICRLEATW